MDWVGIQTGSKDFDKLWPIHVSQVVALFKSIDEGGGGLLMASFGFQLHARLTGKLILLGRSCCPSHVLLLTLA